MPPARLLMTAVAAASAKSLFAGSATAVDQTDASHVAVRHLVAAQIDRMVAGKLAVHALIQFAIGAIAACSTPGNHRYSRGVSA